MFVVENQAAKSLEHDNSLKAGTDDALDAFRAEYFVERASFPRSQFRSSTSFLTNCKLQVGEAAKDDETATKCKQGVHSEDKALATEISRSSVSEDEAGKKSGQDSKDKKSEAGPRAAVEKVTAEMVGSEIAEKAVEQSRNKYFDSAHSYRFQGKLTLIGGSAEKSFEEVVARAKQKENAKIVTVAMASELDGADEDLAQKFVDAGVSAENIVVLSDTDKPEGSNFAYTRELPEQFDLIYFGGGDQSLLRGRFTQSELLKQSLENGANVCGSSAGCAVMSKVMITGGGVDDLTQGEGFALAPWFTADTHVDQRGREWRDISALYQIGLPVLGIDGDTNLTLYWEDDKLVGEVSGASSVRVFRKPGEELDFISERKIEPQTLTGTGGAGLGKDASVWTLKSGDKLILSNDKASKNVRNMP